MQTRLVSVIITAFNEEKFIGQTLDSFLCQSYKDIEIIVVNDGSIDGTARILDEYAESYSNIKIIHFPKNMGKVIAQNAAFATAEGEYIAISGGDDFSSHSRIKSQVDYIKQNRVDFVFTNSYIIDSNNNPLREKVVFYTRKPSISKNLIELMKKWTVPGGTIMFTRKLAEKIYPIPNTLPYEDRWFSFIAGIYAKIGYMDEPLQFYRQHENNSYGVISKQSYKDFRSRVFFLKKRELVYLEEMKKYLALNNLWNPELERFYNQRKISLLFSSVSSLSERFKLLFLKKENRNVAYILFLIEPEVKTLIKYLGKMIGYF